MLGNRLTDLVLALPHVVAAPRRRCGHRGGRRHCRQILAPAPPLQLLSSAVPHRRVLERPRSLTDRLTGRWSPQTLKPLHGIAG
jgi:hypothetical protein